MMGKVMTVNRGDGKGGDWKMRKNTEGVKEERMENDERMEGMTDRENEEKITEGRNMKLRGRR